MGRPKLTAEQNRQSAIERIQRKYEVNKAGCWVWNGPVFNGYGYMKVAGRVRGAHRVSYELFVGAVPEGLQLDHLCRNRACLNPAHLEPVTMVENVSCGVGMSVKNRLKTHCPSGHEYPFFQIGRDKQKSLDDAKAWIDENWHWIRNLMSIAKGEAK
jgi:hypothetical protein